MSIVTLMPNLATWLREKDEKWFNPFFAKHPEIEIHNALTGNVSMEDMDGLLLTGGSDIAPEFLRQEIPDPSPIDKDVDVPRDRWEFEAIQKRSSAACRSWRFAKACKP